MRPERADGIGLSCSPSALAGCAEGLQLRQVALQLLQKKKKKRQTERPQVLFLKSVYVFCSRNVHFHHDRLVSDASSEEMEAAKH